MNKTPYPFPDWLYNALPYFYLCAGLLSIEVSRNGMVVYSGLTLISAGVVVWMLRYRYRQAFQHSGGRLRKFDPTGADNSSQTIIPISWRNSFECGHPVIDAQHRRLFELANVVINTASAESSKLTLELELNELIEHIAEHFCTEEAMLVRSKNSHFKAHQEQHRELMAKALRQRVRLQSDEISARELTAFVVYDVLTDHVLKEDIKWATHLGQWPADSEKMPNPRSLGVVPAVAISSESQGG